jgi:ribosomal protein S18 acetylase RimI-like enzyme
MSYKPTLEEHPHPRDTDRLWQKLEEFNHQHAGPDNHRPLAIFIRNAEGTVVGGLLGGTYWGWLHIDVLWVDECLRRQGYGRRLLAAAEAEAVRRGCRQAHVDSMSFQAPGFYEKEGYTVFGELGDLPVGHSRIFMRKKLLP